MNATVKAAKIKRDAELVKAGVNLVESVLASPITQSIAGLAALQYLQNKYYTVENIENVKVVDEPGHWGYQNVWPYLGPQFMYIPERYHYERRTIGSVRLPVIDNTAGAALQASVATAAVLSAIGGIGGLVGGIKNVAGLLK